MNRRKEDRLIKMAFGEFGSRGEEGVGNPKEAEIFKQYSGLRQSLEAARDIPNHQLSNERLRHAILGEGLHQTKAREESDLGWLWNGLGVCGIVAVLVLTLSRYRGVASPTLNLKGLDQVAKREFQFKGDLTKLKNLHSTPIKRATPNVSGDGYRLVENSESVIRPFRSKHSHRKVSILREPDAERSFMALRFDGPGDSSTGETGEVASNAPENAKPVARTASLQNSGNSDVSDKRPGQDSVVEIEQDRDDNTGARAAREIASKNVIVGG